MRYWHLSMENPTPRKVAISTVLASLLWAAPALAWNGFGHMTVAAVAYDKLTPATKKKVAGLVPPVSSGRCTSSHGARWPPRRRPATRDHRSRAWWRLHP
jgi:hypothetical protein